MAELKGIEYLRNKLNLKRSRVKLRYQYYEMKNAVNDFNMLTPPEFRQFSAALGWCGKAVDCLADRLSFRSFKSDNFDIMSIYQMNNADVLFDSAILSALVSSCCFLYISPDAAGFPRLQVVDGGNATGIIDEVTGLLLEGYAVLERDGNGSPTLEAYFVPGRTEYYAKGNRPADVKLNAAPYPLLVPVIHRPDAVRQFGHRRVAAQHGAK